MDLVKHIANKFIHDRSAGKDVSVGIRAIREACLRQPLAMDSGLLEDLASYQVCFSKMITFGFNLCHCICCEICVAAYVRTVLNRKP
jgi:hypothetical protein